MWIFPERETMVKYGGLYKIFISLPVNFTIPL